MDIPIDVLMCNAGIMAPAVLRKKQGLELQFLTNHLGHFVLVNKLLERVKQADSGRIVMLSSAAHRLAPISGIDFDNLNGNHGYHPWRCYGRSKLANLLVANELSRRLVDSNATANAVHPGLIETNLSRSTAGPLSKFMLSISAPLKRSVAQGAATQCYVAAHGNLDGVSGSYFADCNPARSSANAKNVGLAKKLWAVSEDLAKDYL
jgi:WW domain-containing oxidoreductase